VKPPATGTGASTADPSRWLWPTDGRLLSTFKAGDPSRNGIELAGSEGQSILASAAGEVVYSGNGLIGYGELIIIKHSDRMLSAYGHNRKRLVAEGQAVSAGEKIAEMGRDERNRALLHFEIRRGGTPQDPMKYLPRR
jgi:lipoprotein NlpD